MKQGRNVLACGLCAASLGAEAVNPHFALADEGLIREAHAAGLGVYVYTVDDESQMQQLVDLGVDGLFTNRPDRMRDLLDAPRRRHLLALLWHQTTSGDPMSGGLSLPPW